VCGGSGLEQAEGAGWLGRARAQWESARSTLRRFSLGRWEELGRWEFVAAYPVILIGQVFRELLRDRGLVRASSLAFTTVLSVVPMLTVATTLLGAFGAEDSTLLAVISGLVPGSANDVVDHITQFARNQGKTLTGIGSVVLIILGLALFNNIEQTFNDIWRVRKSRPLLNKYLTFYALITLAPLMMTISILETARIQLVVNGIPMLAVVGYKLLPVGLAFVTFTVANKLLPYTEVRWGPALVSGLVTALAFELAKYGFNIYVETILQPAYVTVYGALSLIPIFLFWVYVSWLILLFGAEMTYTIQNLRNLLLPERLHAVDRDQRDNFNPLLGVEVIAPIVESFARGRGPVTLDVVSAHAGVHPEAASQVLERFVKAGLLLEIGAGEGSLMTRYTAARPLEDIGLLEVLGACRSQDRSHEPGPALQTLHRLYEDCERELMGDLTCASLVDVDNGARLKMLARVVVGSREREAREEGPRGRLAARVSGQLAARPSEEGQGAAIDALAALPGKD
jgi:YihY family inner membrane protein